MSRLYTCFRDLLFLATSFLHAMAIDVTTTWVGDTIKGTTASLQCSWTNGNPTNVVFLPNNDTGTNDFYFNCVVKSNLQHSCTPGTLALSRYSANSSQQGSVSMMISNLQCADDGISYFCLVGEVFQLPTISKAVLAVKVRPTVPTLSNVQTDVQENSNITATCTAVVGYPNAGQIVWKTYQNGRSVDLYPELIITSVNVTQPGDDKCTVLTQSSVTLKANRLHQNISLACFVINQGSGAPETCNPATDLCAQTYPAVITYPVSSVSVTREPVFTLYEGTTVTLKCQAEGNPIPTYTWTKVGDENKRLSIVMDGLVSTLTLTSLNKTLDAGDYTCTVSNVVKNVIHTAFGVISLIIYEPTTSAPTTTSTRKTTSKQTSTSTPTRGTETSGNNNADNKSDGNTVAMIVMGVILSSIIIVQFVVIIFMIRKSQAVCVKKSGERKPHIYDQPNKESPYDYIDSC